MKKYAALFTALMSVWTISAQTGPTLKPSKAQNGLIQNITKEQYKTIRSISSGDQLQGLSYPITKNSYVNSNANQVDDTLLPLSKNGKLLSVDGFEVEFRVPKNPEISGVCATPRPYVQGTNKSAGCSFTVPCDNPANRDAASTALKYFQLEWHVMLDGGPSTNIDQTRIDQLMAELNADFATHNAIFCANPASFYEDPANYAHDSNTEEVSLKTTYNVTPAQVINIYVVGSMSAGGYARFPYDPMGGTSATGGIVLNRGNCNLGTHTLAHEMGHVFGLEHTFSGVDERSECSSCYEQVRNVNGSSNTSGVPTPNGGPYTTEGDQEGDWCSDTHPHDTYSYNCSTSSNPNGPCDVAPWNNAPVNNHMSYSFCSSQFTDQQSRRMHCMAGTYLTSWINYGGGICGTLPPAADFVAAPTTWQAPANINFTDLSAPQNIITGWTWVFDVGASNTVTCAGCTGANATFVGQVPPVVTYPNPGLYTVSLTVTSSNGPDTETKVDYIEVNAPAGDCDTLTTQWETPTPTIIIYGFGGGWITGVPDPVNSLLPTDMKGVYERYFSPNPGVTPVGAVRVGLGSLADVDDDMTFQVNVFDDDGAGGPGALIGGVGGISPTQLGVPGPGFYNEFWIPLTTPAIPTTASFHVGVEIIPSGDPEDTMVVMTSCLGPTGCAVAEGENDGSNHIWTSGYGYENLLTVYGADFDVDIIPMLGEYAPLPLITGYTENVVCDTTYVTLFDTVFYSTPTAWSFTFADGTVLNTVTDPMTIDRVYTTPGPDTVIVAAINSCGRADTTTWIIPYNFLSTPDPEFSASPQNPVCIGAPGVDFTADVSGYIDYTWDFGDGSAITSSGNVNTINHVYTTPGTYYVELTVTEAGFEPLDTFYLETFEGGWPAGYDRYDNDGFTPDPAVNPPFLGTDATAWLDLDIDGSGDLEAVSTSWNLNAGELADDWMLTTGIGVLPANQRLFWDAEALDVNYPDGYEVRISTTQLPANTTNYSTVLFSVGAENSFNTTRSVDLSSYAGQTVYIAFRNNSDWMYLLSIDNIRVGTASPGCSASITKTDLVEVVDCSVTPPTAVLNADVTSGCNPLTVTFTDGTTVGDPATSWWWNFGDGTFSLLQNPPPHVYSAVGTYFVIFEACNTGGCTQDTITITVGDAATISNVTTGDPSCAGNDGTITITASGGTGSLQYSIDNGVSFQASNSFAGLGAATYDIVVEDALGCQTFTTATLNSPLIPNLVITDPAPVCAPGTVDLTLPAVTAGSDAGTLTYWVNLSATIPLGTPTAVGATGTYYIQLDNGTCTSIEAVNVVVNPIPNLVITDPAAVCSPNTVDITAAAVTAGSDAGTLTYWTNAGATIALATPTAVGAGTYYIQLDDANGCISIEPVTVTVNPLPNLVITDPAAVCSPNTVDITDPAVTAGSDAGTLTYWTDAGATSPLGTPTAVGAGTYYMQLTDANGCSVVQAVTVTVNALPNLVITDPAAVCSPNTVDITAAAVTAGSDAGTLTYWVDAGATIPLGGPSAIATTGTYYIQLEDANGCISIEPVTVTVNPLPNLVITDPAAVCSPNTVDITDPAVTAGSDAGTLTYWTDASATIALATPTAVGAGTYYIQLEDANGCISIEPVTVTVNPLPNLVITDPAAVCSPNTVDITDPAVTAGSDAGTLTYWTDAGATIALATPTAVGAGTYYIQLEDANGCSVVQAVTVTVNPSPTFTISASTDPSACGLSDGTFTISGLTPLTGYTLSYLDDGTLVGPLAIVTDAAGDYVVTGLDAGNYTNIIISDGVCQFVGGPVALTDPAAPSFTLIFTDPTTCGGVDGSITIQGLSSLTGYDLTYTDDAVPVGPTAIVTDASGNYVINGLDAGTYTSFIVDLSGCVGSEPGPIVLSDPAAPNLVITDPAAVCSPNTVDITDPAVTAGSDAGTLTYWVDAGATTPLVTPGAVTSTGTYYIQLDVSGCISIQPIAVTVNALPNLVITDPAVVCSPTAVDITDPLVTAGSDAGTLTYWTDASATSPLATPTAVGTGTYYIQLEDANGCSVIEAVNVTVNPLPNLVITDPAAVCSPNTVDITDPAVTAGSDAGTLTYWVDAGATIPLGGPSAIATTGTYYIQLEDANGCISIQPVNVVITATPNLVITDPAAVCSPNTVDLTAAAVTAGSDAGPLSYWMDAGATMPLATPSAVATTGTYYIQLGSAGCLSIQPVNVTVNASPNLIITDPAGVCSPNTVDITAAAVTAGSDAGTLTYWTDAGATSPLGTPTAVGAGTYYIQLTNINGCSSIQPVNVGITAAPNLVVTDPAAVCSPGTVDITAAAVTAGSDPGTLTYWINNTATIPLGSPGAVGATGVFYIQLDNGSCSSIQSVNVVINALPNLVITDPTAACPSGSVDLTQASVTAGSDPGTLTYWMDAGATTPLTNPAVVTIAGTYYIQLTDANGCLVIQAVNVTIAGPSITSVTATDPTCSNANGTITITASGGTGTLQYSIDNGVSFQASNIFSGLNANTYDIIVEDANGCQVASTQTLTISGLPSVTVNSIGDVLCFGGSDGSIDITVTGGVAPYQFDWSNDGVGDIDDPEDLTGLAAGVYSVTVYDSNDCTAFTSATITAPSAGLNLSATATDETFGNDGSIDLTVTGGTPPYTFDWDNDGTGDNDDTEDLFGLAGNTTYQVVVTDFNGCSSTLSVVVGSVVGLVDFSNEMGVSIYPNPNTGEFFVSFTNFEGDVSIDLTDISGKIVYKAMEHVSSDGIITVGIDEVASGMYFIEVKSENTTYATRVVKE